MLTPYQFASNTPIEIDIDGLEAFKITEVVYNDDNIATINVIADNEVWNNYSCNFQLKLPDNSVHKDWAVEGLKDKLETFKRQDRQYILNGKIVSSHGAREVSKNNPDGSFGAAGRQINDFSANFSIPMNKLSYAEATSKGIKEVGYSPVEDLTSSELNKILNNIAPKKKEFTRLDVYVPDDKKETFLNIAKDAGVDSKSIKFVEQTNKGTSSFEIQAVKTETKQLKETE